MDLAQRTPEDSSKPVQAQIKREARLKALAMQPDGHSVAVGDEAGKIFLISNLDACFASQKSKGNLII